MCVITRKGLSAWPPFTVTVGHRLGLTALTHIAPPVLCPHMCRRRVHGCKVVVSGMAALLSVKSLHGRKTVLEEICARIRAIAVQVRALVEEGIVQVHVATTVEDNSVWGFKGLTVSDPLRFNQAFRAIAAQYARLSSCRHAMVIISGSFAERDLQLASYGSFVTAYHVFVHTQGRSGT